MRRYRSPADVYDSDASFSPKVEDDLFDVDENQSDDLTKPTDIEDLSDDDKDIELKDLGEDEDIDLEDLGGDDEDIDL
jgi:hypothetical protein